MIESKKINSNVATSVADSDLVIVSGSSGCLKPITFANLMNAVRSGIQIGGRNLVLNSRQQKNIYPSATYEFSNALEIGKQYTITACLTIPEGATQTVVSLNGSSFYNRLYLGAGNTCTKKIFSRTVTLTHASQTCFCLCDTNGAKCHWVMVTEGNIATAWTPAPEDDWGGVNQRFTTTYKSEDLTEMLVGDCLLTVRKKGGQHERIEDTCGEDSVRSDRYLSFGSLDDACGFFGQLKESIIPYKSCVCDRFEPNNGNINLFSVKCSIERPKRCNIKVLRNILRPFKRKWHPLVAKLVYSDSNMGTPKGCGRLARLGKVNSRLKIAESRKEVVL